MYKIAIPTDDGENVSAHFGQARLFSVVSIEDGAVAHTELRQKAHHAAHEHGQHDSASHPGAQMLEAVADCRVLVAGGMGQPMLERAQNQGIEVILTGEKDIQRAVAAYLAGNLSSDPRRVHLHH